METLLQDMRYALRQMRLSPVFTLTALLTLALGIGATTAIFSLVHAVMLKSLPVADPASLYRIGNGMDCCVEGAPQGSWGMYSYYFYQQIKAAAPEFEQLAAFKAGGSTFSVRRSESERQAKPLRGEFVTGNYFETFGVEAFAGRAITPADDQASATPVAMLSYRAWRQQYGADPKVVGSTFVIEGHPFVIVGISPPGFYGETLRSDPPEIWLPLEQEPLVDGSTSMLKMTSTGWLRVIGRLKPGASIEGLPAKLTGMVKQFMLSNEYLPADFLPLVKQSLPQQHIDIVPAGAGVGAMKSDYGDSLRILLIVCSLVLLIACANIANLLLARGMARKAQTSVQLALGASRKRVIRQSLTESLLLAVMGGALGVAVAYLGARLMVMLAFHSAEFVPISAAPSWPVLGFCFGLSLITGVLFGAAPAWFTSHADPAEALRGVNRSTRDSAALPQKILVVVQATLSVVLLAGAGMLTRSLRNMEHQDFGFATRDRVSIVLNTPPASYTQEHLNALYRELEDKLAHLPGVRSASVALYSPFTDNWGELIVKQGEGPAKSDAMEHVASWDRVSADYLDTIGQRIIRGRGITAEDNDNSPQIVVVNEAFVRRFYKGEDPIGKHFGLDLAENSGTFEIVGVVRNAKYMNPQEPPRPMLFAPLTQHVTYKSPLMQQIDQRSHFIEGAQLWTSSDLGMLEPMIRKALGEVDPNLTIIAIQTMQQQVDMNFDQQRAMAQLTGLFGVLALVLAAVGLYGVTAFSVARRTSEIGIRMALGADRLNVIQLVLRGAFTQVAIGLLIGIPIAIGAGRLMESKLYEVKIWDPMALLAAILALGICALMASVIPAQRAASIEPVRALRTE